MKLLFLGDIVGRSGRDAVIARLPELRKSLDLDFVVANAENAAAGFGITGKICDALFAAGVDVVTGGNHSWDQREIIPYISQQPKLLRPENYPAGTPGKGVGLFAARGGRKVLVVNVMCRLFMDPLDCPFAALGQILPKDGPKGGGADAVLIDLHGEATSEKMALGHYADGRASLAVGSHTHAPTADAQILPGGTAYQTDAGMCGDYDSVIGMKKEIAVDRFVRKMRGERLEPAAGEATLCATYVETDDATGRATHVAPLRQGGRLRPEWPLPA
jgi:metallophosphoesterase (TIGR00282 family)